MNEVQIKLLEDTLFLYKRELKHANKLSFHYTRLVKKTEAQLKELRKKEAEAQVELAKLQEG